MTTNGATGLPTGSQAGEVSRPVVVTTQARPTLTKETTMLYPFSLPPFGELTNDQVAGTHCAYCDRPGPTKPVGSVCGVPLRAHTDCAEQNRLPDDELVFCSVAGCDKPAALTVPVPLCLADAALAREAYEVQNLGQAREDGGQ